MSLAAISVGRGTGNPGTVPSADECLCYRPRRVVLCINCGFTKFGRIHYICAKHPGTIFLLDWPNCPNCKGYSLIEY